MPDAATIAESRGHYMLHMLHMLHMLRMQPAGTIEGAVASRTLRPDQRQAFDHAVGGGGLKVIEGRAGTGKSYVLQAVRAAHEQTGLRVIGLAPTNAVAQDLKAEGFAEAATAHSELFRLKNGRTSWDRRTVVVVDEAAMLDSCVTGELLAEARRTRAKVILAGDDRQLASIERGGLFSELRQRHGSAEISEITRQRIDWQRQAARDLAEGRFAEAVAAFDRAGAITWTQDQVDARAALVAAWTRDTAADPNATRFVFAYTNRDVDALNAELRQVRRDRGELLGPDVRFETKHGPAEFAAGDRVQFTDTLKAARIYNGNVGTITGIDARTGAIRARLDATAAGQGREVTWSAAEFAGVPARLCRHDLQGPGEDPGPHLPVSHAPLALGGELCGADPAARERSGVRGTGDRAGRTATGAANGTWGDQGCVGCLGHHRRADAGDAEARGPRQAGRAGGGRAAAQAGSVI
jgi:ATP-dependent exoDNAse (exonuclease V) alpha subunit